MYVTLPEIYSTIISIVSGKELYPLARILAQYAPQSEICTSSPIFALFSKISSISSGLPSFGVRISPDSQLWPTMTYFSFMVEVFKFDISKLGYFISFIAVIYGLALIVIIRIVLKVLSTKDILFWSSILVGSGMILASIKLEITSWLAIIPIASGTGLAYLSNITLFSDAVDKNSQGWAMGVATSIAAIASCFASVLSGIFPSLLSFTLTYLVAASFTFAASFLIKKKI